MNQSSDYQYAVIFTAEILEIDEQYETFSKKLRTLAFEKYNCKGFDAVCEKGMDISVSLWDSLEDIKAWRETFAHTQAQNIGRKKWYKSYNVKITQVLREYSSD